MTEPRRIQLSRAKGWRKPEGVVVVARPGKWGNPFRVGSEAPTNTEAVRLYRARIRDDQHMIAAIRLQLRGHDLACWCRLDQPCHADVLLEIANTA